MKHRKYYIDWIRVIAFGILIFYHSGMFFVNWGWLVRNNIIANGFQIWMNLINPWRLPLLFFISGVGVSFALKSRTGLQFVGERTKRLLLPLIFGIFVVVPPQIYFERLQTHAFSGNYATFYASIFEFFICPKGGLNWQHLWFVAYLWVFSLIIMPLFLWLRKNSFRLFDLQKSRISLIKILLFTLPLSITYWTLKQKWDIKLNLTSDWYNFTLSLLFFIYGYIIANQPFSWEVIEKYRKVFLSIGVLIIIFTKAYNMTFGCPVEDCPIVVLLNGTLRMSSVWCTILAICGFAKHYLNFTNNFVQYANQVVYPFYILHQTITVTIGYYIADLSISVSSKFVILVVGTFGFTFLIFHFLIQPFQVMRLLFGMVNTNKAVEVNNFNSSFALSRSM